jgi:hypothetical protein
MQQAKAISGEDHLNLQRLKVFVRDALRRSEGLPPASARALLRSNAEVLRRHLGALGAWAADEPKAPCPPHLRGLSAFDLADAAEVLEAEAARRYV